MEFYEEEVNIFYIYFQTIKKYKKYMENSLKGYALTPAEIDVITLLVNNIGKDITAKDIVILRGISKGLVSRAVTSLRRKELIIAVDNPLDKRSMYLSINGENEDIITKVKEENKNFMEKLFKGVTMEEIEHFLYINNKMLNNIRDIK